MKNISYTALYLNDKSRLLLKKKIIKILKKMDIDFTKKEIDRFSHHMTITLGPLDNSRFSEELELGEEFNLTIAGFGYDEKLGVLAFRVKTEVPSINKIKHITAYVREGSKPFLSNKINKWFPINKSSLIGTIEEFETGNDEPVSNSFMEALLYGEDLSMIKNSVILLYEKSTMEVLAYGYDLMSILEEGSFISKNAEMADMNNISREMKKHNMGLIIVRQKYFEKIKDNDFYLRRRKNIRTMKRRLV